MVAGAGDDQGTITTYLACPGTSSNHSNFLSTSQKWFLATKLADRGSPYPLILPLSPRAVIQAGRIKVVLFSPEWE